MLEVIYNELKSYLSSVEALIGKQAALEFKKDMEKIDRFLGVGRNCHPAMIFEERFLEGPKGLSEEYTLLRETFFDTVAQRMTPELEDFIQVTKEILEQNPDIKNSLKASMKILVMNFFEIIVLRRVKKNQKLEVNYIHQRLMRLYGADVALEWYQYALLVWPQVLLSISKKENQEVFESNEYLHDQIAISRNPVDVMQTS